MVGPLAFALSLIAVLVQFSYPFLFAPAGTEPTWRCWLFPIFIVVMAIIQWQLSRAWQRKGWLA